MPREEFVERVRAAEGAARARLGTLVEALGVDVTRKGPGEYRIAGAGLHARPHWPRVSSLDRVHLPAPRGSTQRVPLQTLMHVHLLEAGLGETILPDSRRPFE